MVCKQTKYKLDTLPLDPYNPTSDPDIQAHQPARRTGDLSLSGLPRWPRIDPVLSPFSPTVSPS